VLPVITHVISPPVPQCPSRPRPTTGQLPVDVPDNGCHARNIPCSQAQARLRFLVRLLHNFLIGGAQCCPQFAVLTTQLADKMFQQANSFDEVAH
jgi:hypothetical protein